ncbi:MAG: ABC transporter permease [Kiritimatiellia bacterium]|jgi:ribose transport system permease protein|nr:ABC transporter permease [Kiritimatiellia bacterium]
MKKEMGIGILFLVVCIVVSILNPRFLSVVNMQNMAERIGNYGIFSIGIGMIIITGGIDLSVGSIFALTGVLLAMMLREWNWPWQLAAAAAILVPMALGAFHSLLIIRTKLLPFIVTLCGLLFYRGIARYIAEDTNKGFGDAEAGGFVLLKWMENGKVAGVPMPFVLLVIIAVIMWFLLHRSVYGRYLFAVGKNEEAARYSGINSNLVIASAYVVSGFLVGISGILFAFYTPSITPSSHGNFYELWGIAAAVLGGCSLRGGEGSIIGIVIGAALLQVLQNLVNLLGIPSSLNYSVIGAVILIGVLADQYYRQKRIRKLERESRL